jgi:hypothetical protein
MDFHVVEESRAPKIPLAQSMGFTPPEASIGEAMGFQRVDILLQKPANFDRTGIEIKGRS